MVFRVTVLRLTIGVFVIYFLLANDDPRFDPFLVKVFSFGNYILALAALLAGAFDWRGLFSWLALIESCFSALGIVLLNTENLRIEFNAVLARPLALNTYVNIPSLILFYNSLALGINALIIFYICFHEFRRSRSSPENS